MNNKRNWVKIIPRLILLLIVSWLSYKFLFANLIPDSGANLNFALRIALTTAVTVILAILFFPKISYWINKHDNESKAISTVVSILTIVSIVIGIVAYFQGLTAQEKTTSNQVQLLNAAQQNLQNWQKSFQVQQSQFAEQQQQRLGETQAQQRVMAENETVYLQDSIQDIDADLSLASYFQTNIHEWLTTEDIPIGIYTYPNLVKLEDDVNLDQSTRAGIIQSINDMNNTNSYLAELSSPNFDRNVVLSKLQPSTILTQGDLNALSNQLEDALSSGILQSIPSSTVTIETLKSRALALSANILSFLSQQNSAQSSLFASLTTGAISQADFQTAVEDFFQNTMNQYSEQFTVPVATIRDELARQHLTDIELDEFYKDPTNTFGIQTIAEKIGELADKLP